MKVMRGIALGFWVAVMTGCVSLVTLYFILSQTILSGTAVKGWLKDSGVYASLTDIVVPELTTTDASLSAASLVTQDMVKDAAKESIKPEDVRAKIEPIIDATYSWLDSKSPDISFSVSTADLTEGFLSALEKKVSARVETLPECSGYVDPAALESAGCLPSYITTEDAVTAIMQRVQEEEALRDKALTPESFTASSDTGLSKSLPTLLNYLWVAQLVALPVFGVVALFVVIKRRGGGVIAVAASLLTPGLTLLVLGLLIYFGGAASTTAFVEQSEFARIAEPLGKEVAKDIAAVTLQTGAIVTAAALITGGLGIWWRKRARARKD